MALKVHIFQVLVSIRLKKVQTQLGNNSSQLHPSIYPAAPPANTQRNHVNVNASSIPRVGHPKVTENPPPMLSVSVHRPGG